MSSGMRASDVLVLCLGSTDSEDGGLVPDGLRDEAGSLSMCCSILSYFGFESLFSSLFGLRFQFQSFDCLCLDLFPELQRGVHIRVLFGPDL